MDALPLQLRSADAYALAAGSLVGFAYATRADLLSGVVGRALDDACLVELEMQALEHRREHVIMRKQEQVDTLERARRTRG